MTQGSELLETIMAEMRTVTLPNWNSLLCLSDVGAKVLYFIIQHSHSQPMSNIFLVFKFYVPAEFELLSVPSQVLISMGKKEPTESQLSFFSTQGLHSPLTACMYWDSGSPPIPISLNPDHFEDFSPVLPTAGSIAQCSRFEYLIIPKPYGW